MGPKAAPAPVVRASVLALAKADGVRCFGTITGPNSRLGGVKVHQVFINETDQFGGKLLELCCHDRILLQV